MCIRDRWISREYLARHGGAKNFFDSRNRPGIISGAVLHLASGIYPFAGSMLTTVSLPSETEKRTSKPANRKPYTLSGSF